jgi:high-affinity iron transporter
MAAINCSLLLLQLAGWISTTNIKYQYTKLAGVWFCIFPTVETLSFQALAVIYVLGSYFAARYLTKRKVIKQKMIPNNVNPRVIN